ncbi:hypothetical protein COT30_02860 [Candidatus Micrarchaeota archaeon CG08_land_8_20_14_0_20_49_17]|nr:MAG: hypothetical protein AUJ13_03525 [Candidatus Micrarchaeota archaeon CG1_02_49_24]PIU09747.1 MAG: hypothetical protein COT30_02860 [Candidatus Micrarchaeota archaeon CG08_land_8_20_14_0_20_49_17]PIU82412.1 MAG: hypothetical protein COS70_01460 [Candidatus Micrarchaeota archaeon CG06_land_8_20_14_3_00_50_6]PJA00037.1 MAG: hypothetical protein COX84_00230 [Candidatus Micrarchaeota archaeon CG_4_10_14_0_2_um_filter_49_7]
MTYAIKIKIDGVHNSFMPSLPIMLVIAGSSSDSGAGLQIDLKTAQSIGVYAATAVTCITAQNTQGVRAAESVSDSMLEAQIAAVVDDFQFEVVKIGLVTNPKHFEIIGRLVGGKKIVLDPVMTAQADTYKFAGNAEAESLNAMKSFLKNVAVATPNLHEAGQLSGIEVTDMKSAKLAAKEIISLGAKYVLVKAIKAGPIVHDVLAFEKDGIEHPTDARAIGDNNRRAIHQQANSIVPQRNSKIRCKSYKKNFIDKKLHGSGCMLASAIASYMAKGMDVEKSVKLAERFVHRAIIKAELIGKGIYVVMI